MGGWGTVRERERDGVKLLMKTEEASQRKTRLTPGTLPHRQVFYSPAVFHKVYVFSLFRSYYIFVAAHVPGMHRTRFCQLNQSLRGFFPDPRGFIRSICFERTANNSSVDWTRFSSVLVHCTPPLRDRIR